MQALTAYSVNLFGLKLKFDPVAFTLPIGDGWSVYWYGICIALGFLLAVIYCFRRAKKFGVDLDRLTDVVLITTPLAILCARLYYIIFDNETKIDSIADFFGISGTSGVSGLAIYGGVIGAVLFGFITCKIRKVKVLDAFDLAASGFLIGQAIGRWGNFFNQEAFGSLTGSTFWGMSSENTVRELGEGLVHPCFLYESVWCILGAVLLHFVGNRRKFGGQIALCYGVWYGFGRMIIEGFRTDSLYIGPLRVSQWLSALLMVACAIVLAIVFNKLRTAKTDLTYESVFDDIDPDSRRGVEYYEGEENSEEDQETEIENEQENEEENDG